jgi:peptidoglycan/LPS O-acetylase OafA/YrhL
MTQLNPLRGNRAAYLTNLTPMRGIAALLTVIFHIDLFMGNALVHPSASAVMGRMYLMVDFFFILSGFIMCYVYGDRFSAQVKWTDFKKFTIARFSRVYPLHFSMLVLLIVILYLFGLKGINNPILQVENSVYSVITNILLLHSMNLHSWFTWVHASWSISTEWWAYMLFPFLVAPFFGLKSRGRLLVCLLCFAGYFCIMYFLVPLVIYPKEMPFLKMDRSMWSINVAYDYGFVRCLCGFILGMMMHHAYRDNWGKKLLGNGWVLILLTLTFLACMHFNLPDIITVSFFPLILLSAAYGSEGINKLFITRPLQRLGDWSFSIYLVHQPILITVFYTLSMLNPQKPGEQPPLPPLWMAWTLCVVLIVLVLFFSRLSYLFIENPARRWLNSKAANTPVPAVS